MPIRDYFSLGALRDILSGVGVGKVLKYENTDPYADPRVTAEQANQQSVQKGRVFQRWTYPFRGYSMPILEVPSNRVQRYLLAFEYYTTDALCNAAIRIKTEFALGGLDLDVMIEEDEWPDWVQEQFPEWRKEYDKLVADAKKKAKAAAAEVPDPNAPPAPLKKPEEYDQAQLGDGVKHELENGAKDDDEATQNAMRNLDGDPAHYARKKGTIPGATPNFDKPAPGASQADEMLPGGPRKPSPPQDQPQITDVGKKPGDPAQWQPGQDLPKQDEVPATEVTPISQFLSNKLKLELEKLNEKLDIPLWIIRFAQEAMSYGDGFANIVDGIEVDEVTDLVNQVMLKNKEMASISARYAQAYKRDSELLLGKQTFGKKVATALGLIHLRGGTASMHVGPELLKNRSNGDVTDTGVEEGDRISGAVAMEEYKAFSLAAEQKAELASKSKDYTIVEMQTLNPSAVWVTRDDVGQVIKIELVKRIGVDASPLNIPDIIHWKWQGPDWMTYGMSDFFPAFRHIRLKRSLEEALAANAERYSNPIIQMQVGTDKVARLQVPSQNMIDDAIQLMTSYDRRSVLVTPYHYNLTIHGMEGKPLRLENPLNYAVEQQIAVLGIPKAFLWGDGGNFASVRAQFQTMIFRLKVMQKEAARILVDRIYNRYMKRRGWLTAKGKLPAIKIKWAQHELDSEQSVIGLMNAMANLAKSIGSTELPISYTTLLGSLGHNYEQEMYRKAREKAKMSKLGETMKVEQAPRQAPQYMPPKDSEMRGPLRGMRVGALAEDLNHLSWTRPDASGSKRRRDARKG